MKRSRITLILSLLFVFALIGCQDQSTEIDEVEENIEANETEANQDNPEQEETEVKEVAQDESVDETEVEDVEVEPLYQVNQTTWSVEPISDEANSEVVLLTIDDVPDQYGFEMAEILKELATPAIFFVNGHFIQSEEQQQILRDIHEMGFSIGNHTYTHPNLGEISEEEQRKEIIELNDLIEEIIGQRPEFFRAPHGVNTDFSKEIVAQEGMVLMNWTYGYDYFQPYMDKEKLTEAMISGEGPEVDVDYSLLKPGANLLMHDREWTKEALADIVTGLRAKGYQFVDPKLIQTPSE